jgi:general secretion pathway protein F
VDPDQLYRYRAVDRDGAARAGQIRAADAGAATRELLAQGLTPLELDLASPIAGTRTLAARAPASSPMRARRVSKRQLQGFLHELSTLLGSGISLAEALPSLAGAHSRLPLGPMLQLADQRIKAGASLSAALGQPGLEWPAYVPALIQAGEASGEMAQALGDAALQMEHELLVSQELRNALVYPAVLVAAGIAAVLFIFVAVVPRFATLLRSSRADIPEFSRWVIEAGLFMQQNLSGVALVATGLVAIIVGLAGQQLVRDALLQVMGALPVIGGWLKSVELGRWATVLGALLANRVPYVDAIRLSCGAMRLRQMRSDLERSTVQLQRGSALSEVLERQSWFPEARLSLVRVGERSGELPRMLRSLGELETQSSRVLQKRVLSLIEPAAIVIIGAAVGLIMVAVMMAVTSLNAAVG